MRRRWPSPIPRLAQGVVIETGIASGWIGSGVAVAGVAFVMSVAWPSWGRRAGRGQPASQSEPAATGAEGSDPLRDSQTGLVDRRLVEFLLEKQFAAARRGSAGPAAVVIGIDDVTGDPKRRRGHDAEVALAQAADTLKQVTRRMDVTTRIGADRFLTVLAGANEDGARAFARRVREQLAQSATPDREPLTVSAGIAIYDDVMESPQQLLAAAERALEVARGFGFDRLEVHAPRRTMT